MMPAARLTVDMVGTFAGPPPPPATFEGAQGGAVTLRAHAGLYHELELPPADAVVRAHGMASERHRIRGQSLPS